jgi:hypothetical protein
MSVHSLLQGTALASRRIFALLVCCALVAGAAAESPVRSIDVAYDGETYVVTAHIFAPVRRAIAWEVLTDFTHMAAWVPNLRESNVIKPGDNQLTIEQNGTAKLGPFSFPFTSVREIVMNPQTTIESRQIQGEMRRQQSLMTLSADAGGTQLVYRLELVPTGLAASAMSEERLKRDMEEQFTAIVAEMIKRSRADNKTAS